MPLYDFECIKCNNKFEELCRYDDLISCPNCGTQIKDRAISAFGGYKIKGNNSASVTPKGSGSKK